MTGVSIDTTRRTAHLQLSLAGEDQPTDVYVRYELDTRRADATLTIVDAAASREWLTETLRTFVCAHRFVVSDRAAALMKLLG